MPNGMQSSRKQQGERRKPPSATDAKTRDLFKKIGDTKGTCHTKIGTIKDENREDLSEQNRLRKEKVARIHGTIQKSS